MTLSLMEDAFAHHVWATTTLIDTCLGLTPAQLETEVPGIFGSILRTQQHVVGSDSWYLFDLTDDPAFRIESKGMDLPGLREAIQANGAAWSRLLAGDPDPNTVVREVDVDDGYTIDATVGIRLAQALHHGTDHRSQICTALTSLGIEPPGIDVWDFGETNGRVVGTPPSG
jgi:uncharacterized damage-inducible protein DinB